MGYETALHLVNVKIKAESLSVVKQALETQKEPALASFLQEAFLSDEGLLCFKSTGRYDSPYDPDEEDGSVPVLVGKWYEGEQIAEWLKLHSEADGRLIQHSCDADGMAWGWEFDGRSRLRELALVPVGEWK